MTPQEAIQYLERFQEPEPWESQITGEAYEALEMAIDALEKQIPMKRKEELDITGKPILVCGNCGDSPGGGWDYCSWCGQRIDI